MQAVVFDTSIYISALRAGEEGVLALRRWAAGAPVWLSAVVLEELYAGAGTRERKAVERLEYGFDRARRILTPTLPDWVKAGKTLALLGTQYGYEQIGRARLTNDALLATSAGSRGITVITANERDFAKLREFTFFHYEVRTLSTA
jgi:predicted nucleic acid-binding protein